jgi:hypothetical protein
LSVCAWFGVFGLVYAVLCHFQHYFSYMHIMTVSVIGGGNRSSLKKTSDLWQDTDKHHQIMFCRVHFACEELEHTTLIVIATAAVSVFMLTCIEDFSQLLSWMKHYIFIINISASI